MNPAHLPRIEALLALPLAARKALWTLTEAPGWAYWQESEWCPTCNGTIHVRCDDCDALIDVHRGSGGDDWTYHCSCGEDWPCTEPRCETCGGTGDAAPEWTTNGLGLGSSLAAMWQQQAPSKPDEWFGGHLWLPYSPTDVLRLACGDDRDATLTLWPGHRVPATVVLSPPIGGCRHVQARDIDPLLAALDVLGQIHTPIPGEADAPSPR